MKTQKPLLPIYSIILFGIFLLVIFYFGFKISGNNKSNKIFRSPTPIPIINVKQEIEGEVEYKLPAGWKENKQMEQNYLEALVFSTNDYQDGGVAIKEGALISISNLWC